MISMFSNVRRQPNLCSGTSFWPQSVDAQAARGEVANAHRHVLSYRRSAVHARPAAATAPDNIITPHGLNIYSYVAQVGGKGAGAGRWFLGTTADLCGSLTSSDVLFSELAKLGLVLTQCESCGHGDKPGQRSSPDASPEAGIHDRQCAHEQRSEIVPVPVGEDSVEVLRRTLLRLDPRFPIVHLLTSSSLRAREAGHLAHNSRLCADLGRQNTCTSAIPAPSCTAHETF